MKDKVFTFGHKQLIFTGSIVHRGIHISFETWYERPDGEIYKYPSIGIIFGLIFINFSIMILDSRDEKWGEEE